MSDPSASLRARFEMASGLSPAGMVMVDARGLIVAVNGRLAELLGYAEPELVGRSIDVLVPERSRDRHAGDREAFAASPSSRAMGAGRDLHALRKDGTEVPVEIALHSVSEPEGSFVIGTVVDISARKAVERALRESEERFRLLVDGVRDYAVVMLDPHGVIASWNAGAKRITGYSADEMVGRQIQAIYSDEDRSIGRPAQTLRLAAAEGRHETEGWRVRKDGSRFLAHTVMTAMLDENRRLRGFAKVLQDVTDQRRLEEQLRQAQKMEAIGTLAGGIAHDFNNILGAIVGYGEIVREGIGDGGATRDDVDQILRAAERGRQLVARIMTFSRRKEQVRAPTNLTEPVVEAIGLMRSSLPATIAITHAIDPATPPVLADATQIHQVVMNLATNAAHAMAEGGGSLTVTLAPFRADEPFMAAHPSLRRAVYARLTIADTGAGIPPDVLARVFDPFFTTKAPGAGTGLGLSVVHGIVEAHAGAIDVRSEPGQGTTFDVYCPGIEVEPAHAERPVASAPRGAGQSVLVVDDEVVLTELARRQLERLGYRVTTFNSSPTALAAFERDPGGFDVVVTDNTMPQITGLGLAQRMVKVRPDVRIVLVTGLGEICPPEEMRAAGIRRLLVKPISGRVLGETLSEVLSQG